MSSERRPPDDQELEDFLAGRGRLAQAYREAKNEDAAPAELDATILEMARTEVRTNIVRRPRWLAPLALAATLALSLSILMDIWRDPVLRDQAGVDSMPETRQAAEVMSDRIEAKKAEATEPATPPRVKSAPPPMPAPEPVPPAAPGRALESRVMEESERSSEAESGAAMSAPADAAANVPAPKAVQGQNLAAPAAAAPVRSIEAWVEDIRALRARGNIEAADRELRAFRLAYPDHVLPDDLKSAQAD